jgi:TetR/AcrR family transcriptional regulator, fatty acid metabolism regulator protein
LAERATDRREEILQAAVRVFAQKGYHACRVSDIAAEAGVAHGLLYHYFRSKEDVLEEIFRATWSDLLAEVARIEERGGTALDQLRAVAALYLGSWLRAPDLIRVLVREVARSPEVGRRVDEIAAVFLAIRRIVEHGRASGELRADVDARLATWVFYGALEEILTGWVLGQLPGDEGDVRRAVDTVVEVIGGGLTPDRARIGA